MSHLENNEYRRCIRNENGCQEEELNMGSNVLKSFSIGREIKELKVYCVFEPCNEIIELENLEDHVNNCTHKLIDCPYALVGCNTNKMNGEGMRKHLNDCAIQHSSIMVEHVQELKNSNNVSGLLSVSLIIFRS